MISKPLPIVAALLIAAPNEPAEGAFRKCVALGPDGLVGRIAAFSPETYATKPVVGIVLDENPLVEGRVIGDGFDLQYKASDGTTAAIPARDIVRVEVGCDTEIAMLWVLTRDGAIPFMRNHLLRLVAAQEEYRSVSGRYAADLPPSFSHMVFTRTTVDVSNEAWSATVRLPGFATVCSVAVSSAGIHEDVICVES